MNEPDGVPSAPLPLVEAGELAAALFAEAADQLGVDYVTLKGRAMAVHGFARPKSSADVDVLVRRADMARIDGLLQAKGWTPRPWSDPDDIFPQHSVTYFHARWPVDLDVHFRFPGFERDPDVVLSVLREQGVHIHEAGVPVLITGSAGTLLVGALHLLRDQGDPIVMQRMVALIRQASAYPAREVIDLARDVGALATAEPFLRSAYPDEVPADCGTASEEWLVFSRNTLAGSVRLEYIFNADGRSVPGMVWRAVWPSREALAATSLQAMEMSWPELLAMRLTRLGRGIRSLPRFMAEADVYFDARARGGGPDVPWLVRQANRALDRGKSGA